MDVELRGLSGAAPPDGSTSSSASFDAAGRAISTSQPTSRTKIRERRRRDTVRDHRVLTDLP